MAVAVCAGAGATTLLAAMSDDSLESTDDWLGDEVLSSKRLNFSGGGEDDDDDDDDDDEPDADDVDVELDDSSAADAAVVAAALCGSMRRTLLRLLFV